MSEQPVSAVDAVEAACSKLQEDQAEVMRISAEFQACLVHSSDVEADILGQLQISEELLHMRMTV